MRDKADQRDVAEVRALELKLLEPRVRRDRAAVERLLHPDFLEFGSSARVWDRHSVLAALSEDPGSAPAVSDLRADRLSADAILVTYRADRQDGTSSLRASVWVRDTGGWRVRFHQGTPITRGGAEAAG